MYKYATPQRSGAGIIPTCPNPRCAQHGERMEVGLRTTDTGSDYFIRSSVVAEVR